MKARGSVTLHHSNDTNNIELYSKTQIWQSQGDQSSYFVLMIQIPEKYMVEFRYNKSKGSVYQLQMSQMFSSSWVKISIDHIAHQTAVSKCIP